MPSFYIFDNAVITAFGTYKYEFTTPSGARAWLLSHEWISCISCEITAKALSELTSLSGKYPPIQIPANRRTVQMKCEENPDWETDGKFYLCDEALVFRLVFPSGLDEDFIRKNCELGILRRAE